MTRNLTYGKKTWPSLGPYLFSGSFLTEMFARLFQGGIASEDLITAHAGGTQAAAYQLVASFNRVSVCATNADSVALPKAIKGSQVVIHNDGAATLAVFGLINSGDTINGTAGTTAFSQATAKRVTFMCVTAGEWRTSTAALP